MEVSAVYESIALQHSLSIGWLVLTAPGLLDILAPLDPVPLYSQCDPGPGVAPTADSSLSIQGGYI